MDRPTGENLFAEDTYDYIPGATVFFDVDKKGDVSYEPSEGLPSNPQDYLRSVQAEAKKCPDVVVAPLKPDRVKQPVSVMPVHSTLPGYQHAPMKEWCDDRIKAFSMARQEFVRHLAHLKSIKRQSKKRPKLPVYPLPTWNDERNWRYLCLGNQLKSIATCPSPNADVQGGEKIEENDIIVIDVAPSDEEQPDPVMEALAACGDKNDMKIDDEEEPPVPGESEDLVIDLSALEEGFPPTLRILLRLEPKQIESNLEFHINWMKTYGFSDHQGRWIYALMTCLEKPLFPTVISTLRNLSRQCAIARTQVEPGSSEMNGLNLIMCIVGMYFGQSDLLDPL